MRPTVQYVRVDHIIFLDSVPVGVTLTPNMVENALLLKRQSRCGRYKEYTMEKHGFQERVIPKDEFT